MSWVIETLDRNVSDGSVFRAHWKYTLEHDTEVDEFGAPQTAMEYGVVRFETNSDSDYAFIAYNDLTESTVLNWCWEQIDKTSIETRVQQALNNKINPVELSGVPW